jgi:T5SS/PEP-CTERM-associated repeat protein
MRRNVTTDPVRPRPRRPGGGNSCRVLCAALMTSTALVTLVPAGALAANLTVSGTTKTIDSAQAFDNVQVGDTAPGQLDVMTGGTLTISGDFTVGGTASGADGTATISGGGTVTSHRLFLGYDVYAATATMTISGSGSSLTTSGNAYLGEGGGAATLTVSDSATATFGGELDAGIGGTGTITVSGAGSKLTATGIIIVGDDGTGTLTVSDGGEVSTSAKLIVAKNSGSTGTVTVTGSGSKLTASGKIFIGGNGTGMLTVSDGGQVSGTYITVGRYVGGQGTLTVSGTGSKVTSTNDLYVGDVGSGTLVVSGGGVVSTNSKLVVAASSGTTGTITVTGAGSTLTVGTNVFLGDGGTSGTLTISDGGEFDAGGNVVIGSITAGMATVSGSGSKLTAGGNLYVGSIFGSSPGTLTVSNGGVVQASGTITIAKNASSTGTLNIGATSGATAAAAGSIQGAGGGAATIVFGAGTGTIVFNHTEADYIFNATVSGSGTIDQEAGYTDLTGDFSGFTGAATISGGTLAIDTTFGGSVVVQSGGTLTGTGSAGNITFNSGSIYQVNLTASSFLTSTATVTIDSGAKVALSSGSGMPPIGQSFTILTATNITGTFGAVDESYLFLDALLNYTPTTVDLTLSRNATAFATYAQTPNQIVVANAMESLSSSNTVYQTIVATTDASQLPGAFDQLSGEAHASFQSALIQGAGTIRDIVGQQIGNSFAAPDAGGGGVLGYTDDSRGRSYAKEMDALSAFASAREEAAHATGYHVWGQAYGASGRTSSDGNAAALRRVGGGAFFGVDTGAGTDWRLGAFAGCGYTSTKVSDRRSDADVDSFTAGAYGARLAGPVSLQFGTSLTWNDIHSKRDVAFTGFSDHLTADYGAATLQAFGEAGYSFFVRKNLTVQPFAGAAVVYQRTTSFTEQGGAAALSTSASSQTVEITTTGLRTAYDLGRMSSGTRIGVTGSAAWRHTFGTVTPSETMTFASGSDAFTVSGTPLARDTALVGAGVHFGFLNGMDLTLTYNGAFAPGTQDSTFNARLQASF